MGEWVSRLTKISSSFFFWCSFLGWKKVQRCFPTFFCLSIRAFYGIVCSNEISSGTKKVKELFVSFLGVTMAEKAFLTFSILLSTKKLFRLLLNCGAFAAYFCHQMSKIKKLGFMEIQQTLLIVATLGLASSGHYKRRLLYPAVVNWAEVGRMGILEFRY